MTKKYKINGHTIELMTTSSDNTPFLGGGKYSRDQILIQLLDALSDKEDTILTKLQSTVLEGKNILSKEKVCDCGSGLLPEVCRNNTSKPKQEECDECDGSGFMLDHDGDYNTPCDSDRHKQSTSLNETLVHEFRVNCADQVMQTGGLADFDKAREHIISLIQSHLVKEIDKLNPIYSTRDTNLGYSDAKLDIIKIINNLK